MSNLFEYQERSLLQVRPISSDEERLQIDEGTEMKLAPACPACGYDYGNSSVEECPTCGATRPMVPSS